MALWNVPSGCPSRWEKIMAKIVQSLTQPPKEYDQLSFLSLVRDLNGLIEKLNTTFQEEKTEDNDAVVFFLG